MTEWIEPDAGYFPALQFLSSPVCFNGNAKGVNQMEEGQSDDRRTQRD
ncbi:MAG: hypothetical protein ACYC4Q_03695 [Victivallaceae bacterium]